MKLTNKQAAALENILHDITRAQAAIILRIKQKKELTPAEYWKEG